MSSQVFFIWFVIILLYIVVMVSRMPSLPKLIVFGSGYYIIKVCMKQTRSLKRPDVSGAD